MNVHYTACPVCNSTHILPIIKVKDYSVSGQQFEIWQCGDCTLRFTQDAPDESSIAAFYKSENYISHTDTSKGIINQVYKKVRSFTLQQKAKLVESASGVKGGSLLDIGSGTGAFLYTMKKRGWKVSGIEPDDTARKLSEDMYGIVPQKPDAFPTFPQNAFNAITMWHVLEHVHSLHDYVEGLKNLLNTGGRLFIAVPNYTSLDATIYQSAWAAYDVPRHLYHFTPISVSRLMEQHGLKVIDQKPMWFDAFYIALLSSKYRWGSTRWMGAVWSGLRSNAKALSNKETCSSIIYIIQKA